MQAFRIKIGYGLQKHIVIHRLVKYQQKHQMK